MISTAIVCSALIVLYAVTGNEVDTMQFAFSLVGCDDCNSSAASLHIATLDNAPVRVRLTTAPQTSPTEASYQRQQPQQSVFDVTVTRNKSEYIALPTHVVCRSSSMDTDVVTRGVNIVANGRVEIYATVKNCLPAGNVRRLRPVRSTLSSQLHIVPDSSIDGTTFQPRRLVVDSLTDNTTLRVVRLNADDLDGSSSATTLHAIVIDAFQTFIFDVGGTLTLDQLVDGDSSSWVGQPLGIFSSKPVTVVMEGVVDGSQSVFVQLDPTEQWGSSFSVHRPVVAEDLQRDQRYSSYARIVAGRNATGVRVTYTRSDQSFHDTLLRLPAGYRHLDIDISAAAGSFELHSDRPISVLELNVQRPDPRRPHRPTASADCIEPSSAPGGIGVVVDNNIFITSSCDCRTGNGFIDIAATTNVDGVALLNTTEVEIDGRPTDDDHVVQSERDVRVDLSRLGNQSSHHVPLVKVKVKVKPGLHVVTLSDHNVTQFVFVECLCVDVVMSSLSVQSTGSEMQPTLATEPHDVITADNEKIRRLSDVMVNRTVLDKLSQTMSESVGHVTVVNTTIVIDYSLDDVIVDRRRGARDNIGTETATTTGYMTSPVAITTGRQVTRDDHVTHDVIGVAAPTKSCDTNSTSVSCRRTAAGLHPDVRNYSDLSPAGPFHVLVRSDDVTKSEHFHQHGDQFDASLITSPTVIAVISSLVVAIFFVIACIVGFVVAELACSKGGLQRVKVSPFVDDFE